MILYDEVIEKVIRFPYKCSVFLNNLYVFARAFLAGESQKKGRKEAK